MKAVPILATSLLLLGGAFGGWFMTRLKFKEAGKQQAGDTPDPLAHGGVGIDPDDHAIVYGGDSLVRGACIPLDGLQAEVTNLSEASVQAVTAASKKAAVIKALGGLVPIGAMMMRVEAANIVVDPGDHASTFGGDPLDHDGVGIDPDHHAIVFGGDPLVRGAGLKATQYERANHVLKEVEVFSTGFEASCAKNLDIFETSAAYILGSTFQTDLDSKGGGAAGDADSLARGLLCIELENVTHFNGKVVSIDSNSYISGPFVLSHTFQSIA